MYFYSLVNSIEEGFVMGSMFGVMIMICLGWLTGALFATTKPQLILHLVMLVLCCILAYLILMTGVQP